MTYATTFSGIGCWEIGLSACDWGLSWQCEKDAKLLRFLAGRFGVPIHGDIRTLSEACFAKVDVLIGSPPCQPFSTAGKRGGTSDERHLYPSFLDAVRHFKPRWVLMEQVPAILSPERNKGKLVGPAPIGAYIGGLATLGYLGCYHCIPASAIGAPHQRDRIWIIAHAGHDARCPESIQQRKISSEESSGMRGSRMDANTDSLWKLQPERSKQKQWRWASYLRETISNTECLGGIPFGRRTRHPCEESGNARGIRGNDGSRLPEQKNEHMANSYGAQREGDQREGDQREIGKESEYSDTYKSNWWEVEPNVGRVANGSPNRLDRLKGLGNGLVPKIPYIIGRAINEVESISQK